MDVQLQIRIRRSTGPVKPSHFSKIENQADSRPRGDPIEKLRVGILAGSVGKHVHHIFQQERRELALLNGAHAPANHIQRSAGSGQCEHDAGIPGAFTRL
jgi:hypothetical protein